MPDAGDPPSPRELERIAAAVARAAAAAVVSDAHRRPVLVGRKSSPTDVVTETDLYAEDLIRSHLRDATPGAGVLREERGETLPGARLLWVTDPLDVATGFSIRAGERMRQGKLAARLLPRVADVRCFGSAALELCWVGCGRVDAYYQSGTAPWDRAAGALIAAEAGADVELPCPENDDLVLAAASGIFDELRPLVLQYA